MTLNCSNHSILLPNFQNLIVSNNFSINSSQKKADYIVIIGAQEGELKRFYNKIYQIDRGEIGSSKYLAVSYKSCNLIVVNAGIGIERAKKVTSRIIDKFCPRIIISIGSCGALDKTIKRYSVVIGSEIFLKKRGIFDRNDSGIEIFYPEINLCNHLFNLVKEFYPNIYLGRILSVKKFIHKKETKQLLNQRYKALVVEMESGGVAQVASKKGIPFLVVKVVSDESKDRLLDYSKITDSKGGLLFRKVFISILLRPWEIVTVLRFSYNLKKAYKRLYLVMEKILNYL